MSLVSSATRIQQKPLPAGGYVLWAFGGGKGGIGKSFLTTNIAVCVAQIGYTVTLVDLDLTGANLHTCIGNDIPKLGLSDFLQGKTANLKDLTTDSKINRLSLVGGVNDSFVPSQITPENKQLLKDQLRGLPSQFVFLDLGAGASDLNAEFFTFADQSVLITTPEPTSIENSYQFIRTAFHRVLKQVELATNSRALFNGAMENRLAYGIRTPQDLVRYIMRTDADVGARLKADLDRFKLKLILNQVRTKTDIEIGYAIKTVCRQYFGMNMDFMGFLDFDNAAWQSARKKQPLVLAFPFSHLSGNLFNIAKSLVDPRQNSAIL
ncbi:MAG: P-loop NTPase [Bdellovibrionia bacterium]